MTSQSPPAACDTPPEDYRNAWASIQHLVMVEGASWSGREKNCAYLGVGGMRYSNVSSVSSANYPDDARAVAAVDWDDDGRLDLIVKNRTAPRLRFLRGQGPEQANWLKLDLRGTTCNLDAVGAVAVVELEGRTLRQTLHAGEGYLAQSSKRLHFGLGDAEGARAVSVEWPGGETESFGELEAGGRYLLVQGTGRAEPVAAMTHADFATLEPAVETRSEGRVGRAVLVDRMPLAPVFIPSFEDARRKIKDYEGRPLFVNLWESTCAACLGEFGEFRERRADLDAAGLALVPLTLDEGPKLGEARRILDQFGLARDAGYVDGALMKLFEVVFIEVFGQLDEAALPTSLLFDASGQLAVIYRGAVDVDQLLADVEVLASEQEPTSSGERLTDGHWYLRLRRDYATLARVFGELGRQRMAELYQGLAGR